MTPYCGTARTLEDVETSTIGGLAHEAGVNVETIRYYQRRGLLRTPPRSADGYRLYTDADLRRLQFIARAKTLGFTLAEVALLVEPDGGEDAALVARMARSKLQALEERQRMLEETRSRLEGLIDLCGDPLNEDCTALRVSTPS